MHAASSRLALRLAISVHSVRIPPAGLAAYSSAISKLLTCGLSAKVEPCVCSAIGQASARHQQTASVPATVQCAGLSARRVLALCWSSVDWKPTVCRRDGLRVTVDD